jgi:outer membrane protein assembly factor BamA
MICSKKLNFLCLFSLLLGFNCYAEQSVDGNEPSAKSTIDKTISKNNTIKKISIRIHPIFDESKPKENNFLFRFANRLHVGTDIDVIKNDLLFGEGSLYDKDILYESERILRTRRYLNSASITVADKDAENVEVNVDVNEVWTLVPTLGFSRLGGSNDYSAGFKDSNFLGYGKSFNVTYNKSDERSGELFEYVDPNTGWHQTGLGLAHEDNSDGSRHFFSFERPYFSLSTPNAGGFIYEEYDREESYYNDGDEIDSYRHFSQQTEFFYGARINSDEDNIKRLNIGYSEQDDTFSTIESQTGIVDPPQNRLFKIAWVEYQTIQNQFSRFKNIRQINRVEDINFGWQTALKLGYVYSPLYQYNNSIYLENSLSRGLMLNNKSLILGGASLSGFHKEDEIYNGVVNARLAFHWKNMESGQFYLSVKVSRGLRLFADEFLVMGGDFGLRGYPDNYQSGDKRYLVNIEQRFYGKKEWLSLFYMGFVLFYDEGRAWGNSASPQAQGERLRDLGFGLRISGTRNGSREEGSHNVLHVDVAHPFDGGDVLSGMEISVRVRKSF